jgi:hypothetical protein
MVRAAVFGALLFEIIGQFVSYLPKYHIRGLDVTWLVGTLGFAVVGAASGASFTFVACGISRVLNSRSR